MSECLELPRPLHLLRTVVTVVLIATGIAASVLWLRSVLRRLSIGLRFAPAAPV
jgi:hypothetical protein